VKERFVVARLFNSPGMLFNLYGRFTGTLSRSISSDWRGERVGSGERKDVDLAGDWDIKMVAIMESEEIDQNNVGNQWRLIRASLTKIIVGELYGYTPLEACTGNHF
jgi:hypothetical protein